MYYQSTNCMTRNFSPSQLQLLNMLRRLWVEHIMWTRSFIISTVSNLGDLDSVTNRLLRNPADFASVLIPLYGNKEAMRFEKLFTDHLLIAAQLINAAKKGDSKTVEEQRKKWYTNADNIANFLGDSNPFWSKATWQTLLYDHLKMTENEAVQILSGQYAASIAQYDSIQEEALNMADYMACGIISQFQI